MSGAVPKPSSAVSRRTKRSPTIDPALMEGTIRACCDEAKHALNAALGVLESAGILDGRPLSPMLLVKLAACCRLRDWEQSGVLELVSPPLPTFDEAVSDFIVEPLHGRGRFPDLAQRVFGVHLRHAAWQSSSMKADVMVSNLSAGDVVGELANLLFQFRDLVDERPSSGPEED